jgi:hypothetical protein
MGWFQEGRENRKAQEAVMRELTEINRHGGRGDPGSMDPDDFVILARRAVYLGGWEPLRDFVQIQVNCKGAEFVTCGAFNALPLSYGRIAWDDVVWVEITDGSRSKSRVAATVAFGVAGLGTKSSEHFAELLLHLSDGRIAAFSISDMRAAEVRARASATFASVGVRLEQPQSAPPPVAPQGRSLVDELERLAALHTSGAISDEEFTDFTQQLRSS